MTSRTEGVEQFLVAPKTPSAADSAALQEFIGLVNASDQAAILEARGAPVPTRLVAELAPDLARQLRQRFAEQLIIEHNAPLHF